MGIAEKVAYLKGLAEGLKVNDSSKEGKILVAVIDVLEEITETIENLDFDMDVVIDEINDLDEELSFFFEDEECYHGQGGRRHHHSGHGDCCHGHDDYDGYEGEIYQVTCPRCDEEVLIDEDILDDGEIICPNCEEVLEIDFSGVLEDEEE